MITKAQIRPAQIINNLSVMIAGVRAGKAISRIAIEGEKVSRRDLSRFNGATVRTLTTDGELTHAELSSVTAGLNIEQVQIKGGFIL